MRFHLTALALFLSIAPVHAQQPASASASSQTLGDPLVVKCRLLAGRRTDPALDSSMTTRAEQAWAIFQFAEVYEAATACREALAAFPGDRKVIVAEDHAADLLALLAIGAKFPDAPERQVEAATGAFADGVRENNRVKQQTAGFFLGSAHEFGVGTPRDLSEAMTWYLRAADAGNRSAQEQAARLLQKARDPKK